MESKLTSRYYENTSKLHGNTSKLRGANCPPSYQRSSRTNIPTTVSSTRRGVNIDEPTSPVSKQWNTNLDNFVQSLSDPKLGLSDRSPSLDSTSESSTSQKMKLKTEDLADNLRENCSISSSTSAETMEKMDDASNARKSWRKRMMERRSSKNRQTATADIDEMGEVHVSFGSNDDGSCEIREMSLDSTSSSGQRDSKQSFNGDSSPENSDPESHSQEKSTDQSHKYTKRDKDSKKRRFRRMITRPLRRSHSAGCEKDIPAHALFMQKSLDDEKDTMESRAADLNMYHRRLLGDLDASPQMLKGRTIHKTCSADAAMMANEDFGGVNGNQKKSRNIAKNMKKKFQFLRRRNTDSALGGGGTKAPLHIRPTPDQALQWSKSFDCLLSDKGGLELFRGFLRSEFSEENLEFWIACQDYKTCDDTHKLQSQSQRIYGDFVAIKAPKEINLDSKTRMQTVSNLEHPTRSTFEDAQKRIQALMEKDSYPRFLESEFYQQLISHANHNSTKD